MLSKTSHMGSFWNRNFVSGAHYFHKTSKQSDIYDTNYEIKTCFQTKAYRCLLARINKWFPIVCLHTAKVEKRIDSTRAFRSTETETLVFQRRWTVSHNVFHFKLSQNLNMFVYRNVLQLSGKKSIKKHLQSHWKHLTIIISRSASNRHNLRCWCCYCRCLLLIWM